MSTILTDNAHYSAIASAIRSRANTSVTYRPSMMASAILDLVLVELGSNAADVFAYGRPYLTSASGSAPHIDDRAFVGCDALETAMFPSASYVGSEAFAGCEALRTVSLASCKSVGGGAFSRCTSLSSASLPACESIGTSTFVGCTSLASISLPGCTSIGSYAFQGCASLSQASLPTCEWVGGSAFQSTGLATISLPACEGMGFNAFQSCPSLTYAFMPVLECVSNAAFNGCTSLGSFHAPIADVGANAFQGCASLLSADLPGADSIGDWAFGGCTALSAVSAPIASTIGGNAFNGCVALSSFTANMLTVVNTSTFSGCVGMSMASFVNCSRINANAFNGCNDLMALWLLSTSVTVLSNANAFTGTPMSLSTYTGSFGSVYVPASLYSDYYGNSRWSLYKDRLASVSMSPTSPLASAFPVEPEMLNAYGMSVASVAVVGNTCDMDIAVTTSKSYYEGFCLPLRNLAPGSVHEMMLDLSMPGATFSTTAQMRFAVLNEVAASYNVSSWPCLIDRTTDAQSLSVRFVPSGSVAYLAGEFGGLMDGREFTMEMRNIRVAFPQWV